MYYYTKCSLIIATLLVLGLILWLHLEEVWDPCQAEAEAEAQADGLGESFGKYIVPGFHLELWG